MGTPTNLPSEGSPNVSSCSAEPHCLPNDQVSWCKEHTCPLSSSKLLSFCHAVLSLCLSHCSHVVEVLVTLPSQLAGCLLLPSAVQIFPALRSLYPGLYPHKLVSKYAGKLVVGGVPCEVGMIYTLSIDRVFNGFNVAAILAIVNFMHMRIVGGRAYAKMFCAYSVLIFGTTFLSLHGFLPPLLLCLLLTLTLSCFLSSLHLLPVLMTQVWTTCSQWPSSCVLCSQSSQSRSSQHS